MTLTAASLDAAAVRRTRCLIFAYHEMGYACMAELLAMGAPIAALYTHRDAPGEEIWWRSCADLARVRQIPTRTPERIDAAELVRIRAWAPAVIYSFYYRNLIDEAALRIAPLGSYNLHGSMLPKYRGRAPINWMLANGEHEAGATLHHMVARADAGDIVAQRPVPITDDDTALTLYRKIVPTGAALIREFHPLIVAGRAPRRPQNLAEGSYFGRRRPADGRIDWRWPARRVFNLVRAVTHPYPGAFCVAGGRKLYIWRAAIVHEDGVLGAPGSVLGARADGALEVAAGTGGVIVSSVQFEGGEEGGARSIIASAGDPRAIRLE